MSADAAELVGKQVLFCGMSESLLKELGECASLITLPKGQRVALEGDPADAFYIVLDGRLSVEISDPSDDGLLVQSVGPGEVFGWSWIFPPYLWAFSGFATAPTRALVFDGVRLRARCEANPRLGYELVKRMARVFTLRLQETRLELVEAKRRLAALSNEYRLQARPA